MTLEPAHREKVTTWIKEGAKLSEIQDRLAKEFGVSLTYMEVRLLVDDLKLVPKDVEPAKPMANIGSATSKAGQAPHSEPPIPEPEPGPESRSGVRLTVDQLARPGAVVSGKVTFSDGKTGQWYFDHTGRLGLLPPEPGYRPSPADLQEFQANLELELSKLGM